MTAMLSFGTLLKQVRKRAGMTQRDLAAACGYSDSLISSLEHGQRQPDLHVVIIHFIPALGVQDDPPTAALLIERAAAARGERPPDPATLDRLTYQATPQEHVRPASQLPAPPTALVGRDTQVHQLCNRVLGHGGRLLTLVGPPGIGKTRLALAVAARLERHYADGARFVPLAAITDPTAMASTIVGTVDDHEARPKPPTLQVIESLRRKRLLLLLDNCEQIVGAAPLVANVLAACPGVSILATSRERLHLRAEQRYRVPPLELPAAVDLFAQRAAAVNVEFTITAANRPTLEAICQRLDHLPLALELCAAQADLFAPAQILAQLHAHPLDLLENGAHDLPPQHRTLRNAIERSYDLLLEHERALFRRLGVFVGGWTVEAVEAVCACAHDAESHAYVSMLHALIGKSLVHAETTPTGERRFLLLETIREYALEYLEASGEVEHLRRQHARYYATFADTAYQTMLEQAKRTGNVPDWDALARQTQPEYANLQAALVWSQTMLGDPEVALQLTNDLADLWLRRGMRHEAIAAMERTLHHPRGIIRSLAQFGVRVDLAQLHALTGNYAAAHMQYAQALALAHELGDTYEYAWTLRSLGWLAREQGDITTARVRLAESLAIFRELDHAYGIAVALYTLAGVAIVEEDPARAEEMLTESRAVAQRTSFPAHDTARILQCLGHVAQLRGAYDRAAALHHESRALFPSDHHTGLLGAYHGLGESALGLGQLDEAAHWLMQGLVLSEALSDRASIAWCLAGLGGVAALSNRPKRAARLWGAAEALRTAICCRSAFAARTTYERALAVARTQLDEEAVAAAWIAGRALLVEQAIAEALQPDALATAPPAAPRGADPAIAETPVA